MSRFFLQFSILLTLLLSASLPSYGADSSIYVVEEVAVNATGKSPNDARSAAIASARRSAFSTLVQRLNLNSAIVDIARNDEISDMVRSEQINDEKIAGNVYSASFSITFAKDFVDHFLDQKNLVKSQKAEEKKSDSFLIIPVKVVNHGFILWEENNEWRKAIDSALARKSDSKFLLADADVTNIGILNKDNVERIDYSGIEPMLARYKSSSAYLLFFSFDDIENKVAINLVVVNKFQKKQIKLSFVNVDRLSYDSLLSKVASKTVDYLSSYQKDSETLVSQNLIRFEVAISGLGNWMMTKNKIETSGLVSALNIESISKDFAIVSVNYIGSDDVVAAFSKAGFSVKRKSENLYNLSL